jgi:hypothetical protein
LFDVKQFAQFFKLLWLLQVICKLLSTYKLPSRKLDANMIEGALQDLLFELVVVCNG